MNKLLLIVLLMLMSQFSNAQNANPTNGDIHFYSWVCVSEKLAQSLIESHFEIYQLGCKASRVPLPCVLREKHIGPITGQYGIWEVWSCVQPMPKTAPRVIFTGVVIGEVKHGE